MWYIHIFALFELYLVQLDYKIKLSRCTPHWRSTTISLETKPSYSYVVDYNACSWCEAKSNQIYLIDCAWSRNLSKTQHTSYTNTLTLLKYFSSTSHDIILSLSYDLISYTLFLLFLHFFFYYFTFFQSIEFMFHTKTFSSWFVFFVWKKFDHMN